MNTKLELAYEVLKCTKSKEGYERIVKELSERVLPALAAGAKEMFGIDMPDVDMRMLQAQAQTIFPFEEAIRLEAEAMAESFEVSELCALLAHYKSPLGQKLLAHQRNSGAAFSEKLQAIAKERIASAAMGMRGGIGNA